MCVLSTPSQQVSYKDHVMRLETLFCMPLSAGLFEDEETQARTGPRENLRVPTQTRLCQTLEDKQGSQAMSLQQPLQNK